MGYWKEGDELNHGKYLVEQILGSGGFGVTYRIRHTKTNKLYALKTLNEIARNKPYFPQLQSKFINEAIALASCSHQNIVQVYPQGFQEGELWCMVMEYIEGKDLSRHLDSKGKFPEAKAVKIINKVGEALSFVHQKGLLHRDIKPANILLRSSDETPVLIDFGLAREYNANPDSIRSMTNSMTESFAPIEQYQRQGKFGAWTDVYALAATLYVLVTKELPLTAKFREHAPLVPPKKHNPQISDRINEAIVKGLELQPGDRPQTVREWLEMLEAPKPKTQPLITPEYIEAPTVPVASKNSSLEEKVTVPKNIPTKTSIEPRDKPPQRLRANSSSRNRENTSDRTSQTVTRRNWLKYSGLAIASMVLALVGKEIFGNSSEQNLKLAEYEFDVITVNDKGEEINREQGQAEYFTEDLSNGTTLEMVEIPGGTFMMGSPEEEFIRGDNENPQHEVTVPSFYMGKYEVTQAQWKAVSALPKVGRELKSDPSYFKGEDLPVESVSWYDAAEFCARLSKNT